MAYARVKLSVRWCSVATLLVCILSTGFAQKSGMPRGQRHELRHEIDQLEQSWRNAVMTKDVAAMDSLLAEDYVAITASGTLQSKEQTLTNLRSGTLNFSSIEFSDRKVRFYDHTALVTSRAEVAGSNADGDLSGSYRYTRVYVRDAKGVWKIVSFEASRIRESDDHK
jgi:ketosteroid isomerase-like protein